MELLKYTKFNHFVNLIWFNLIFENLVYFDNHQEVSSLLRSFVQIYISVFAILSLKSKVSFKIRNLFSSINGVIYDVLRTWFVCQIYPSFFINLFPPFFGWLPFIGDRLFTPIIHMNFSQLVQNAYEFNLRTMGIR